MSRLCDTKNIFFTVLKKLKRQKSSFQTLKLFVLMICEIANQIPNIILLF